jgi:peptidoglycan/LPS O-acetylase OafA/YrhL
MDTARLGGADAVRAAACLLVIFHHLLQRLDHGVLPAAVRPLAAFFMFGSFGVAAFFVLSGYLLSRPFWRQLYAGEAMPSIRTYAIRRTARIAPAFWLALTVSFFLDITLFAVPLDGLKLFRYVAAMFFLGGWHWSLVFPVDNNGPLWSIGLEVACYVFMPLCLAILYWLKARNALAALLLFVGVTGLTIVAQILILNYWPVDPVNRGWDFGLLGGAKTWVPRFSPASFYAIFSIGILAGGLQLVWRPRPRWLSDAAVAAGLALCVGGMLSHMGEDTEGFALFSIPYGFPVFPLGVGLMLVGFPSTVLLQRLVDNPFTAFVARISFGLYLWHFLVLSVMGVFWIPGARNGGIKDLGEWGLVILGCLAFSTAIATASFYLLEQPIIRWARGLERRETDTRAAAAKAI